MAIVHNSREEAIAAIKLFHKRMKDMEKETGAKFIGDTSDDSYLTYYVEAIYKEGGRKIVERMFTQDLDDIYYRPELDI